MTNYFDQWRPRRREGNNTNSTPVDNRRSAEMAKKVGILAIAALGAFGCATTKPKTAKEGSVKPSATRAAATASVTQVQTAPSKQSPNIGDGQCRLLCTQEGRPFGQIDCNMGIPEVEAYVKAQLAKKICPGKAVIKLQFEEEKVK